MKNESVMFAAVGAAVSLFPLSAVGRPDASVMSDAYWKIWNEAEQRRIDADIEANRKADGAFVVRVPDGTPVAVEQLDHEFRFGAHIFNFNQLGRTEWNQAYRDSYGLGGLGQSIPLARF